MVWTKNRLFKAPLFSGGALFRRLPAWACLFCVLALAVTPAQAYIRTWTRATASGPASGEQPHGAVAFQNKIWAKMWIGGLTDRNYSIVSSTDGVHWTTVMGRGPQGIDGDQLLVFNNKLWLVGGRHYYSTDGIHWTAVTAPRPSAAEASFAVHNGKLWWQGYGLDQYTGLWSSSDGITWAKISAAAQFKRSGAALVSFAGKLWMIGGHAYSENKNDIWASSDGITWQQVSSGMPTGFRRNPAVTVFENKLWLLGGAQVAGSTEVPLNDLWYSGDGKNWTQLGSTAPWPPRANPAAVVYSNRLWILGGYQGPLVNSPRTLLKDVWSMAALAPGKPAVAPIANQQLQEGKAFTGPEPVLTAGSLPITWTLPKAPAGMTINPRTGVVQWSKPTAAGSPHTVTLRAVNSAGLASASFLLTVSPLRPRLSAPAWSSGTHRLAWTAVPGITGYTLQRDDAPDFASPVQTVTVTSKTLQYTFVALADGKTAWYRVRGNRIDGVANAWSNMVSVTQDVRRPGGTVKINNGATSVPSNWVTLNFQPIDAGTPASGVASLRLGTDGSTWSAWEPFVAARKYLFTASQAPAPLKVYVQFMDRAGNVSPAAYASTRLNTLPICVDAAASANNLVAYGTPDRPFRLIGDALRGSVAGKDIYVAQGRYPESANLALKTRMKLLGGFPRNTFTLAKRNPGSYLTTVTTAAPYSGPTAWRPVFVTMDSISTATLDGLRFDGGNSMTYGSIQGIYCRNLNSSCRIANCTVTRYVGNVPQNALSSIISGGILCSNATPVISGCVIEANRFNQGAGIYFFWNLQPANKPLIENCVIRNNFAQAMYRYVMHTTPVPVGGDGAGIWCFTWEPIIRNCLIYGNGGSEHSYGINSLYYTPNSQLQNCTIYNNGVGVSGWFGGIKNCIIWGNAKGQINGSNPWVSYSCIQGGSTGPGGGTGNLTVDPQFVNAAAGDFRLNPTSPCIDAGGMIGGLYTDLAGTPRGVIGYAGRRGDGSHFDMGAYEYWLAAPAAAPATGVYASPLKVALTGPAGATLRYTLDGNVPTERSAVYTAPLTLTGTPGKRVTVTARAFKSGLTPSNICVRVYTFR